MHALILGCGNIGALYDWETAEVNTYAKAFYSLGVNLSIYDKDLERSKFVAARYDAKPLNEWNEVTTDKYDIVVVSTPTSTHFEYLTNLLSQPPTLVICEKPVDSDIDRLNELKGIYENSSARVIVNYFRRFQPKMFELAKRVQNLVVKNQCKTIIVNYQRGFHNNASHALDLLAFLFGKSFKPSNINILNAAPDEFETDPTMSVSCCWNDIQIVLIGLVDAKFSNFEISLYFSDHAILLKNCCDEVEFFSTPTQPGTFYPTLESDEIWKGTLRNHMLYVAEHACRMVKDTSLPDNFMESINISKTILAIKSKGNI